MSDADLDEFLDTIDDDDLIGGGGDNGDVRMSGVAAAAFSSAAVVRSASRGSSSSGGRKSSPSGKKGKASSSVVKFPAKLHDMLTQSQLSNGIMEWRQEGTCFKILDRDRLAAELLPIYFVSNVFLAADLLILTHVHVVDCNSVHSNIRYLLLILRMY